MSTLAAHPKPKILGHEPFDVRAVGARRDPELIRRVLPFLEALARYFRAEVVGVEHVPDEAPFLVVGNHSGGTLTPDMYILLAAWFRQKGLDPPAYGLAHRGVFVVSPIRRFFEGLGAIGASHENAERALDQGAVVLVYPGGDWEAFRPWWDRNKIDFGGNKGFVRLALRKGVPVLPAVSIGSHESLIVLSRGDRMARVLRLDRLVRLKVLPVSVSIPWGVLPGFLPGIPLPAKVTIQLCPPIDWRHLPSDAADDPTVIDQCYEEVVSTMQHTLNDLAARRRLPVLG